MEARPPLRALAALFAFACHAALAQDRPPPWPPQTDLAPDPEVLSGVLENGLRYALKVNHEPRERASVRMLVAAGSLDETDEERGLAHYLEHMAFNGTKNFAADTLVEWFQRNGMSFGGDSNASTGFETTTYMLELPHADSKTLAEGLRVLRDFADGMLLSEDEITRERGIIFAEKRARDSVEFRTTRAEFEFILPDTLPPRRFPIGVDETLNAADAERLRGFYEHWYQPQNIILTIVGEIEPPAAEKLIREAFGPMQATRGSLPPRTHRGEVRAMSEPVARMHREPEASAVSVSLQTAAPFERRPDSVAVRLRDLPLDVANAIISRRLALLAKTESAPFTFGAAGSTEAFDFARVASIELTGPPDRWRESLATAEQELRRALTHGFSQVELNEIRSNIINGLEESVRSAPTRHSAGLASGLAGAIFDELVFTTPATNLEFTRPAVESLTPEDCLGALREAWSNSAPRIFVSGKLAPDDAPEDALGVFHASAGAAVAPPGELKDEPFAYTDFGPPGTIISRKHVEDLDLVLVEFANGVRLNLKRTDFRANSISLRARLGGGRLELPIEKPELAVIAGALLTEGGLGKHSKEDLRRVLAGRTVSVGFGVADDAFQFSGGTSPKDLEPTLQLLCAYMTDPGWRSDALAVIRRGIAQSYERMLHLPGGVAQMKIPPLLASGDPRFGTPPLDRLLSVSADDVRHALAPAFASADLEVAIIGDIDIARTIDVAASTIGALSPRRPRLAFARERVVHYPQAAPSDIFPVETDILKSLVLTYWPTTDARDVSRARRLSMLASVIDDRLRKVVREELGAAYSPNASSAPSDTYPGYGLFSVSVEADPSQARQIHAAILRIADELRKHGVTEDELERAREPALTAIRESARQNGYWLSAVLDEAQSRPEFLDHARTREADYRSITKADLDALAATYFDNGRAARFVVEPAAKSEPSPAAPGGQ
ncbi:MAG TPA: insulinase family protein [Opitutaceae bacterium]